MKKKIGSGSVFEKQVRLLLESQGWEVDPQYELGFRLGKRSRYRVDFVAGNESGCILVSCKYQASMGSAMDKIPYEYMCLADAVESNRLDAGYIVLFGSRITKDFFLSKESIDELSKWMRLSEKIKILDFEAFQTTTLNGGLLVR